MDVSALQDLIAEDKAAGLRPWLIIASAGTTDTGAVDPVDAIAKVAKQHEYVVARGCGLRWLFPVVR